MEKVVVQNRRVTLTEYFNLDADPTSKYEFHDGELIAMAGGSESHSLIISNIIRELGNHAKGSDCRVYDSNLRVGAKDSVRYFFPDAFVVCGEREFDVHDANRLTVTNPKVLVEVLSPSTERIDRGEKFKSYIRCDSFQEYLLVDQFTPHVELIRREPGRGWLHVFFEGLDTTVRIESLKIDLPMSEIYANVAFERPA